MCEKLLRFSYEMHSEFDREITRHDFRLMCLPRDDGRQRVEEVSFRVSPYTWLREGRDGFGNRCLYGAAGDYHSSFSVCVTGLVRTGSGSGQERGAVPDEAFRYQTPATAPGILAEQYYEKICGAPGAVQGLAPATAPGILAEQYYEKICGVSGTAPGLPSCDRGQQVKQALYLMECLHRDFRYQSGTTDTVTTSEQALERGCGVCQDYAQILITLCRMAGIPARYVAGMMAGEGETHAWTEILSGGQWHALDPTHNCMADGRYIKLSHGRDCRDCLVNRGIYFNPAHETQTVDVYVTQIPSGEGKRKAPGQ